MEVAIKFYRSNRRYQVIQPGGKVLHTSGLCANSDSAFVNARKTCSKNGWVPTKIAHF